MDLSILPKALEDIILNYVAQMEHTEKFGRVLQEIKEIDYRTTTMDNCMSFRIINGNVYKTYHIKFCRTCGKYYRTNIVHYATDYRRSFRYSHYNTFMNEDDRVLTADYIVSYGGDTLYWTNFYRNRKYNKYISCSCIRNMFDGILAMI